MSLNESTVEAAALGWVRLREVYGGQVIELGYAVGYRPYLVPDEPAAEPNSFGEVVMVERLREAGRRLILVSFNL